MKKSIKTTVQMLVTCLLYHHATAQLEVKPLNADHLETIGRSQVLVSANDQLDSIPVLEAANSPLNPAITYTDIIPVGVENLSYDARVLVYPNPFNMFVAIKRNDCSLNEVCAFSMVNMEGRVIAEGKLELLLNSSVTVELPESIKNGVYTLQLFNSRREKMASLKMIKQ